MSDINNGINLVGIAGLGHMGKIYAERLPEGSKLAAVWSHDESHLRDHKAFLKEHNLNPQVFVGDKKYPDFIKSINSLIVCSPTPEHYWQIFKAIVVYGGSGIRIMSEKPITSHYQHALALFNSQKNYEIPIHVACQLHFHRQATHFINSIDKQSIKAIHIRMLRNRPYKDEQQGIVLDIMPHILALLEFWGIWPLKIVEKTLIYRNKTIEEEAYILFLTKEGIEIKIDLSCVAKMAHDKPVLNTIEIQDDAGRSTLDFNSSEWGYQIHGKNTFIATSDDIRALMLKDWLRADRKPQMCTTLASAIAHMEIIDQIYRTELK